MHDVLYENARLYPMGPSVHPVPEGCFAIKDGRFSALGETVRARRRLEEGGLVPELTVPDDPGWLRRFDRRTAGWHWPIRWPPGWKQSCFGY